MHVWFVATVKNRCTLETLCKQGIKGELTTSHFEVPIGASCEDIGLLALDLIEAHHSSAFDAEPWHEIQFHGCELSPRLESELKSYGNTTLVKQIYGFNVTRSCE